MRQGNRSEAWKLLDRQRLIYMIFVQALRLHLDEGKGVGWMFALCDKQVGAAIGANIESRRDAGRWRRWPHKGMPEYGSWRNMGNWSG